MLPLISSSLTSFPTLLLIALYEREAMKHGTTGFYNTISVAAEKVYDTLPRGFTKRIGLFNFVPRHIND